MSKFCPWRSAAIKPGVGLKPYIFAYAAGPRHEPIWSVPSANGNNPEATAELAPPLDPAADFERS